MTTRRNAFNNVHRGGGIRKFLRYQRGVHNLYIEGQTTQWPKEKRHIDK